MKEHLQRKNTRLVSSGSVSEQLFFLDHICALPMLLKKHFNLRVLMFLNLFLKNILTGERFTTIFIYNIHGY